ncbi:Ribosomal RNA small subunit methyltransferase B [uncultured Eubacterium sp.]|nr:Ribosomal RNA small subunit methyltransferase B [uncultured Eubacterium sp.]
MDINRKTAYNTLLEMETNQAYSNIELNKQIGELQPDSPAFVRELVYGVIENRVYLDHILQQLIPKGLKGLKKQTLTLLRMGLYQLIFMDSVPDYAAVNEIVKMARRLVPGRDGFVNGVLRGYNKKKDQLEMPDYDTNPIGYLSLKYSFAEWIVKLWNEQYGLEKAEQLLAASNSKPPVSIRVNRLKISRKDLAERLSGKGFEVEHGRLSERSLFVKGSGLLSTEEFESGLFSVQDESSILAAEILAPKSGETIIDVCAAPGGKTLAISEIMANTGRVLAFDIYEHKLELLKKETQRLGISIIETGEHDGTLLCEKLVQSADRVLVDGPCSGLGVIRRKPEIKYKELEDDGRELADKQLAILETASQYVKKEGFLLYSTCTVNKIENAEVVSRFLRKHKEYELVRSRQLLPGVDETDGFFICKMRRRGS